MRALRNLMSDLTTTLGQTNAALGINTEATNSRKYANRSSVANLEALWSTHMQELWRKVEGSHKYLPAIPGRHVVCESANWVELNPATLKPRRRVRLILLNDHLLVAVEKKRSEKHTPNFSVSPNPQASGQMQLVADHCWPLHEVDVLDMGASTKQSGKSTRRTSNENTINLRIGLESVTYEAIDKAGTAKSTMLAEMRKAIADCKNKLLNNDERGVNGARPVNGVKSSSTRPLSAQGHRNLASGVRDSTATDRQSIFVEVDGRQQNLRWVEGQVDQLDIDIALQRFDEAVRRIEQLRRVAKTNKSQPRVQELVDDKVHDQAARLSKLLIKQLVDTNSWATSTKGHVAMLTKLGFEARASEAYLEARSNVIRTRIR